MTIEVKNDEMLGRTDENTLHIELIKLQLELIKLQQENQELKKQLEKLELTVGLRQKRNLIHKFDKEYDEEDKKKNPNRDYAGIMPDAEEVYRRYYAMKNQQKEFINFLENEKDRLARECSQIYEDDLGKTRLVSEDIFNEIDKISIKYKEITGNDINVGSKGGKDER